VCGYNGIIGEICPKCGRKDGDGGIKFERIRRITGYLVGTLERFNDAKRSEEHDRVKHMNTVAHTPDLPMN
ncbi:MAG: anaerobic ribonucleoside-triphosphate reductase, partial [Victivallaceae bacterium]